MSDFEKTLEAKLQNALKELELHDAEDKNRATKRKELAAIVESIQERMTDYKQAQAEFNEKMAKMQEAYNTLYLQAQTGEGERATFSDIKAFGAEAGLAPPVDDSGEINEQATG